MYKRRRGGERQAGGACGADTGTVWEICNVTWNRGPRPLRPICGMTTTPTPSRVRSETEACDKARRTASAMVSSEDPTNSKAAVGGSKPWVGIASSAGVESRAVARETWSSFMTRECSEVSLEE